MLNDFQKYRVRFLSIKTRYEYWSTFFNFKEQVRTNDKNVNLSTLIIFDNARKYVVCYKNIVFHNDNQIVKSYNRIQENIKDFDHEKIVSNFHVHFNDIDTIQALIINSNVDKSNDNCSINRFTQNKYVFFNSLLKKSKNKSHNQATHYQTRKYVTTNEQQLTLSSRMLSNRNDSFVTNRLKTTKIQKKSSTRQMKRIKTSSRKKNWRNNSNWSIHLHAT